MDKETLSNYGWVVIAVLVLSIMIALATPFGTYISNGVKSTPEGLFKAEQNALNIALDGADVTIADQEFSDVPTLNGDNVSIDMSTVDKDVLANNSWETIQKVIQSGKISETNWAIGDISPEFQCDGQSFTAKIIGVGQDGDNTATFIFTSPLCYSALNDDDDDFNFGGFAATDFKNTLSSFDNKISIKNYIKPTLKTSTLDYENINNSSTDTYKLFLPSVKEVGLQDEYWWPYPDLFDIESTFTYTYFQTDKNAKLSKLLNNELNAYAWLRTVELYDYYDFFGFIVTDDNYARLSAGYCTSSKAIIPAFVIG